MSNRKIINAASTGGIGYYPVISSSTTDTYYDNVSLLLNGDVEVDSNFANVSLLLDGNVIADKSNNKAAVTAYGNASVTSVNKKFGTGSIYFDGSGDYIRPAASNNYMFGTGDFTVEFWVYRISGGDFFGNGPVGTGSFGIGLGVTTGDTTKLQCGIYGYPAANVSCVNAFPSNQWAHVAITRASGTTRIFVNGIKDGENVNGGANNSTNTASIGEVWVGSGSSFNGYIDDLRITKGVARYTSNFTPPVKALPTHEILDSSVYRLPVTAVGDAKISTATKKFGTGSMYFDGSGDYLSMPAASAIDFSAAFTIEFWMYPTAYPTNSFARLLMHNVNNTPNSLAIAFTSTGLINSGLAYTCTGIESTTTVPLNNWTHVALSVTGTNGTGRLFLNGVLSATVSGISTETQNVSPLYIGVDPSLSGFPSVFSYYAGYLDDIRITKGYARYTANFTPPSASLPTIPPTIPADPWWGNVSLLLDGNTTDAYDPYWQNVSLMLTGDDFIDWSNQHNAVTVVGNTAINTTTKKFNFGSMYFDGSGDYLSIASNASLNLSSLNFTIEYWIRPTTASVVSTDGEIIVNVASSGIAHYYNYTNKQLVLGQSNVAAYLNSTTNSVPLDTWTHVALVRSGNVFTFYINGQSNATYTGALTFTDGAIQIGAYSSSQYMFNGYLADLRITKGIARTITVPTAALPSYKIQDRTQNNLTVTPYGNVQLSTDVMKNGTGSMFFDGTGDYLTVTTSPTFNFGTGDFTVEMWVNPTSVSTIRGLFAISGGAGAGITKFVVHLNSGTPSIHYNGLTNGANIYTTATSAITAGIWTHLAFTRSGSTWVWYINGIAAGTGSNTSDITFTSQPTYAGYGGESYFDTFNGYIDDLRITKGYARYTQNFTPPSQSFATQYISTGYDANYADVSLLLNGNGTNGSQVFTDLSGTPKTITAYGNAQISTAVKKYGTGAISFDGSGDYLTVPSSAGGFSGDFTIEGWFYYNNLTNSYCPIFDARNSSSSYAGISLAITYAGIFVYRASTALISSSTAPASNSWFHFAVSRSGSSIYLFINGIQIGSTATDSAAFPANILYLGAYCDLYQYTNGYIDDFRITKGIARYTANFTPPTYQLPTDTTGTVIDPLRSSTSLLLRGNGTNGSTSVTDESPNGLTVTNNGSVTVNTTTKKYGTGSMAFNGTSSYLSIPYQPVLNLSTGDWTVELWWYPTSTANQVILTIGCDSSGYGSVEIQALSSKFYALVSPGSSNWVLASVSSVSSWTTNTWYHLAYCRQGNNFLFYVNGVNVLNFTDSSTLATGSGNPTIVGAFGTAGSSYWVNGYIDDLRITKGFARYTANFTPPTYEDPIVTGTVYDYNYPQVSLLLNGDGTNGSTVFKDLSSSPKTITAYGNAQISTAQKKFGTGSIYFDGTGDYIKFADNVNFAFGTGDFTVELWFYRLSTTGDGTILDTRNNSDNSAGFDFSLTSNGALRIYYNGSATVSTNTMPLDSWTYLTLVRSGNTLTGYINGAVAFTISGFTNNLSETARWIGTNWPQNAYLKGYIDDFRITKGLARYTQNFTPPTAPLPTSYS